MFTVMFPAFIC